MILRPSPAGLLAVERVEVACPECLGAGSDWYGDPEVATQSVPCLGCDGRGVIYQQREIPREEGCNDE